MPKIWYQLYSNDGRKLGRAASVRHDDNISDGMDIEDLTVEIKKANVAEYLRLLNPSDLFVYPPGTAIPVSDAAVAIDPGDEVAQTTTASKSPFIVVLNPPPPAAAPAQDDTEVMMKRVAEQTAAMIMVKRQRNDAPRRSLSFVSKSHAFSEGQKNGRYSMGHSFFFETVAPVSSEAFKIAAPKFVADENKIHHPYFLREVSKLIDSAINARLDISQQLLWTKSGHWLSLDDTDAPGVEPDFATTGLDTSRKNDSGSQFYVGKESHGTEKPSKYDVLLTFEQKKKFVSTDLMEAIDYTERVLRIQKGREVAYSALFYCCENEKKIYWLKTTFDEEGFKSEVTKPASLSPGGIGQQQLLTMLMRTPSDLGRAFPDLGSSSVGPFGAIKISLALGQGATSNVFLGKVGSNEGVLKVLNDGFQNLAAHEAYIFSLLQGEGEGDPSILTCTQIKQNVLFFNQALRPIKSLSRMQAEQILSQLENAHKVNVVHRDIRPDNIMLDVKDNALITDWGFAHVVGGPAPAFRGTFRFAGDDVLDAALSGICRQPRAQDDLESFVRLCFALENRSVWSKLSKVDNGDFAAAKAIWKDFKERNPRQNDMFEAAVKLDYKKLKEIRTVA